MSKSATVRLGVGAQRERDGLRVGFVFLARETRFLRDLVEVVRWKRGEGKCWSAPGEVPTMRIEVRERRTVAMDLANMVIIQIIVQGASVMSGRWNDDSDRKQRRNVEFGAVTAY